MAKGGGKEKFDPKKSSFVEGSAVRSAVAAFDKREFANGYPDTMDHHINRGGISKKTRREGAAD